MYLAFDIGGSAIKYGVVSDSGEILEKNSYDEIKPEVMTEKELLDALSNLTEGAKAKYAAISGIGISAPGVVSTDGVMKTFGALLELYGMDLKTALSNLTGLPVAVINDANATAIAEKWVGAGKTLSNFMVMALGTGVGGGIVIDGKPYTGGHGMAGEFGWALTDGISRVGELEDVSQTFKAASRSGLVRQYNMANRSVTHNDCEDLSEAKDVVVLVEADDPVATVVWDQYLTDISVACINLFSYFDPEVIFIGGGISANDFFMAELTAKFESLITRHNGLSKMREMGLLGTIQAAGLKNDAGLIGAAYTIKLEFEK
jgi:predicted NBD/HSP70 family sugar kinase